MAQGLLRVSGTLELDQIWPAGSSDADTTKILVSVENTSFQFRPAPGGKFRTTKIFAGARVKAIRTTPCIKNGKVTIRLQGIDAPELHYKAANLGGSNISAATRQKYNQANKDFRQFQGETAASALYRRLKKPGIVSRACTVETAVDEPGDAWDMYGRLVGDIFVRIGNKRVHINDWTLRMGWAFPSLYNSMSDDEILSVIAAAKKGRTKKRIWKYLKAEIVPLEQTLTFRGKGVPLDPKADRGPLMNPKLFRRQVLYEVRKAAGLESISFFKFVVKKRDDMHLTQEFLGQGAASAPVHFLGDFLQNEVLTLKPEDIVFRESPSKLIDANGEEITGWW